jgi:hypothetical protein
MLNPGELGDIYKRHGIYAAAFVVVIVVLAWVAIFALALWIFR